MQERPGIQGGRVITSDSGHAGQSRVEQVYSAIKSDIVSLKLRPGYIIQEGALASQYGVSRTPVREALRRLGQERLVETLPKKGTIIAPVSVSDVVEIAQMRLALEPLAVRLATGRIPLASIERQLEAHRAPFDSWESFDEAHRQVHSLHYMIIEHCGNRRLESALRSALDDFLRVLIMTAPNTLPTSRQWHIRILEALAARDGDLAERLMREHLIEMEAPLVTAAG